MKRKLCYLFVILFIQNFVFCIDFRIKRIINNLNGTYTSCGDNIGLFFDNSNVVVINMNNNNYIKIHTIDDEGKVLLCNVINQNNNGKSPIYTKSKIFYQLKYGYNIVISAERTNNEASMFNHSKSFRPIPYYLYAIDGNNKTVFDLNMYRLENEAFYPTDRYTSTSEIETLSKEESKKLLINNPAWTMYQGCTAINNKQNRLAVILNQYNVYKDALCIFEILYDAKCNDDKVRLRTEPNLNCETITFLNKNDNVKIKDQSDKKAEIDSEKWYWYQVELLDGTIGWVYGKYLDIEK